MTLRRMPGPESAVSGSDESSYISVAHCRLRVMQLRMRIIFHHFEGTSAGTASARRRFSTSLNCSSALAMSRSKSIALSRESDGAIACNASQRLSLPLIPSESNSSASNSPKSPANPAPSFTRLAFSPDPHGELFQDIWPGPDFVRELLQRIPIFLHPRKKGLHEPVVWFLDLPLLHGLQEVDGKPTAPARWSWRYVPSVSFIEACFPR